MNTVHIYWLSGAADCRLVNTRREGADPVGGRQPDVSGYASIRVKAEVTHFRFVKA
jgi:hypothetical protein